MSVNANYSGNIQPPIHLALATGTKTVLFSAPNSTMMASSWAFTNPTAAAVNCEFYWNDGTTDRLIWRKSVAANGTEVESNLPVRLLEGQGIKVLAASAVTATLILTQAGRVS